MTKSHQPFASWSERPERVLVSVTRLAIFLDLPVATLGPITESKH